MKLLRYPKSRDFWQLYERARYLHDIDRDQWRDLLHSKGVHTKQEIKQKRIDSVVHALVKIIIVLSLILLSYEMAN